ncbi:MAG: hypothetical protein U0T33_00270 [Bacteroidales bacterium]
MTDNLENQKVKSEEVDLLDIFKAMGRGIKNMFLSIGKAVIISVIFIKEKWIYLLASLLIGATISFLIKLRIDRYTYSEMIISSNTIENYEMISYINNLHKHCIKKNWIELSKSLKMVPEDIKPIKDVEAFWIIDNGNDGVPDYVNYDGKFNVYDTVNVRMTSRLAIRIIGKLSNDNTKIKESIFKYIENNPYFIAQNTERLNLLNQTLSRLEYDIVQLDSLQKIKYFEETKNKVPEKGGQMVFLQEQKTQLVYNDIYNLWSKKQNLERQKNLFSGIITLLNDFTPPDKLNQGLFFYPVVLISSAVGLCLIILIFSANKRKILDFYDIK